MKPANTTTSGKATDMIAGICMFPRLPCPSTKRRVILTLPLLLLLVLVLVLVLVCYCTAYCWLVLRAVFFFFFQLSCESYMVMDVVTQNPQKRSGYDQGTTMRKTCESWLQDVLLLLSFLLWCSDNRRRNTRTGAPWCIADWLLQVLRSRLITTNY